MITLKQQDERAKQLRNEAQRDVDESKIHGSLVPYEVIGRLSAVAAIAQLQMEEAAQRIRALEHQSNVLQAHVDELEELVPLCKYCGKPMMGRRVDGMHPDCSRELQGDVERDRRKDERSERRAG